MKPAPFEYRAPTSSAEAVQLLAEVGEQAVVGETPSSDLFAAAAELAANNVDPMSNLHASAAYRRDLTRAMIRRALDQTLEAEVAA